MRTNKRWLAWMLSVLMLVSVMPTVVMAEEDAQTEVADEVTYNLWKQEITVGYDESEAESDTYALFNEDDSYVIVLDEETPYFPYEVQFTCEGETESVWFETPEDTVEVGGHTFSIQVNGEIDTIGFWVGEDYVPAYPEAKEFVDEEVELLSLLPLKERNVYVHLDNYLKAELANVKLAALLENQGESDDAAVVWMERYDDGNYTITDMNTPIDLMEYSDEYNVYLELIVGTADQLDTTNTRYIVCVNMPDPSDWITASAQTFGEPRAEIGIFGTGHVTYYSKGNVWYGIDCEVDPASWTEEQPAYVMLDFDEYFDGTGLEVAVYENHYFDIESLTAAAPADITAQIWGKEATGYLLDPSNFGEVDVTFIFTRLESGIQSVMPFTVRMEQATISRSKSMIYIENDSGSRTQIDYYDHTYRGDEHYESGYNVVFELKEGYPANGQYFFNLKLNSPDPDADVGICGINLVDSAFVGVYDSKEEAVAAGAEDIKEELFSYASGDGGYQADYSQGVTFTYFYVNGEVGQYSIKTIEYQPNESDEELPVEPDPLSADTYFQANGAKYQNGDYYNTYSSYVMPYEHDSYYYNGYQTMFLLNNDDSGIADGTEIFPTFYSGNKVHVYNSHDGASGQLQESGKTALTFKSGEVVQYSASAENGTNLKNYWVTYLTQQPGAKLFVNGATNSAHRDEETGLAVREVFLDDRHGNHHDIFFANIGDTQLEGLSVTLTDAVNVQLDPYWTINEVTTLDAFTDTEGRQYETNNWSNYGELKNVAKIRLIPTDTFGVVSGTLTISSSNGGTETIKLTGLSGVPQIVTTSIVDGVKYVPYSSLLQTNNMYGDNLLEFIVTEGALPEGVEIKPNGEIYGVPTEAGEFAFTVKAIYNNDESMSDTAEFTLVIAENSNINVLEATDTGYEVTEFVGEAMNETGEFVVDKIQDELFWTGGAYGYFIDFWMDGEKLTEGVDYASESGSTKVTIYAQTFKNAGKGTHTIAAEFREGDSVDGTLKRAAQNFTLTAATTIIKPVGPSRDEVKPSEPEKPEEPEEPETNWMFKDVEPTDWFCGDVEWAFEQELMIGVADDLFAPQQQISLAMVVTTLARMSDVDLNSYQQSTYEDISQMQWYTEAAVWAKENGILGVEPFSAMPPLARARLAVVLANYLAYEGIDTSVPANAVVFADADEMTVEELQAFQVLYHYGIFNGVGNNYMNPKGATTRAEYAALLHRVSVFVSGN